MFKKIYTKLSIDIAVNPGDDYTQNEIMQNRKEIKRTHKGHIVKLKTDNHKSVSYLVADTNTVPTVFHPIYYYVFSLLGLSLPYRWYMYFNVGHVKVKVMKLVYQDTRPTAGPSEPWYSTSILLATAFRILQDLFLHGKQLFASNLALRYPLVHLR